MKITLVCDSKFPASEYDDKGRVVWWLGKELTKLGHEVCFLARKDSECDFAKVLVYSDKKPLETQIPADTDLVHFHDEPRQEINHPFLITQHDNSLKARQFHPNTVFLSDSQARLHGATVFVYPGVDFSEYATVELGAKRLWFHFLGNASKRGRNVRGAIDLAAQVNARLHVIGGSRINFRQGISIPLSTAARFHGALSSGGRDALLNTSKGLVFPVVWPEPFSLSVVESLYFGCPVFGTPFGALPEILGKKITHKNNTLPANGIVEAFYSDYGCLSMKKAELAETLKNADDFDRVKCHTYALETFSSQRMAQDYLPLYAQVLKGKQLHPTAPEMFETPSDKLFSIQ